ncbi:TolC family outer membrane protein [Pseudomonas plecoglossicida]|uniref:Channel protein TolC n=1 Tax=Pseudomonas plecoglossicida TaxID=70775 RepID=A0AAD0QYB5_PSEDL|nr:TolC family outer membrane protein [Pseudomonas plecoglossicida]AXM97943.1 channel protein TolC [Pseudomonas plecoglossicida]EPB94970.1 TolC family type I secretion outer membrane protein [Pseudomonas plecoglossicida NB2011]QLB54084.1 TolC family outer membrane protein [Pseudomonas plecoglossicida]GLR38916.1 TolC family type I secretion outer membrane protein [Pseudomonas plecoglossicida]
MKRRRPLSPLLPGALGLLVLTTHPVALAADDIDPSLRTIGPSLLRDAPDAIPARPPSGQSASADDRLGLSEAVLAAAQWHPSVAEAIGNLYKQGEGINVARAGYYPQLSGGIRTGYDSGYGGDRNSQALNLSLKQMLYDFGKVDSAVDAAHAAATRAQANILLVVDDLARDTAYAWIETRRYEQLMVIAREQIRGVDDIAGMARQRSDMGASTRSDLVQAESRVEAARATLEEYQAQYQRWRSILAALLGRVSPPALAEEAPPELNQACKRPANGDDRLPAVLMALALRAQSQAELAQAKAEAYPTLSLQPQVNHYLDNDYDRDNHSLDRTQAGIYLNLEVPIYQGGAISARSRAAGHALSAADSAEDAARLQARRGLAEAMAQTSGLGRRLNSLEARQVSIQEARMLYGRQYLDLGTRPLLDLLNAEQEIYQSRFDLAGTRSDLLRLDVDCLYNTGGLRSAFGLEGRNLQGVEIEP